MISVSPDEHRFIYITIVLLFTILFALQIFAFIKQRTRNILVYLFTFSLSLYTISMLLSPFNSFFLSYTHLGLSFVPLVTDILKISALALFILFVLIIAKGWPTTRPYLNAKPIIAISWIGYLSAEILLYAWTKGSSMDVNTQNSNSLPVWISLSFRVFLMLWFLFELRATMMIEQEQQKLRFYLHFGVGIMVWFVYLPIIKIIGLQITLIWKYNLIKVFSLLIDFMAYSIIVHFLWPTKLTHHFLTQSTESDYSDGPDEENGSRDNLNCYSNVNFCDTHNCFSRSREGHSKA